MFTFLQQITLGDLLLGASILIASVGLFLNYFKNVKDSRIKRSEFIMNLFNQFSSNTDMVDIYLKIRNGRFIFNKENFHDSEDARKIEIMLGLFENIAALYFIKNITLDDIKNIAPEFLTINNNAEVKKFLKYLDDQNKLLGINEKAYKHLRNICEVFKKEEKRLVQSLK